PFASVTGSGATAVHCAPSDDGSVATLPSIPDVCEQLTPVRSLILALLKPLQAGMELEQDLKSAGFPKQSQRPLLSPFPSTLLFLSKMFHGWELWILTMELSFQPSSSWPKPFL